jgi:AraC-like DNA-binding protein
MKADSLAIDTISGQFDGLEEYCAVMPGHDLLFQQLDCGPSAFDLDVISTRSAIVQWLGISRRLHQSGALPKQAITFGLVTYCGDSMSWSGHNINGSCLLVFPSGNQYESLSPAGFSCYTATFMTDILGQLVQQAALGLEVEELGRTARVIPLSERNTQQLRYLLGVATGKLQDPDYSQLETLQYGLPLKLLRLLAAKPKFMPRLRTTGRSRSLQLARDYINDLAHEEVDLSGLHAISKTSQRTLQRAFIEHYQMTPRDYLRIVRLNRARAELLRKDTGSSISEIALSCGFNHLGKFSASYRQQFGELPRQTVKLSRG